MSNIDDYNKLVDFIGNIIKATSDPEDQEGVDDAFILESPALSHPIPELGGGCREREERSGANRQAGEKPWPLP